VGRGRSAIVALVALAFLGTFPAGSLSGARAVTLGARAAAGPEVLTPAAVPLVTEPREPDLAERGSLLVRIPRTMPITARPGGGRVVGTMPEGSRFYGQPLVAWVLRVSEDGRFGLVPVPYAGRDVTGWISLRGLERRVTHLEVVADLSERRIEVFRRGDVLFGAPAAVGARVSPTPTGRYFVTDRVGFPAGGSLGTFAFGISGIQTDLPPGWTGGDQLAIHGTNAPATIGSAASAGCLRVSERVLDRLRVLLRLGTPVEIVP
jgi:lipoprotein-anchoring transpeptidase ErfK/SrfK